MTTHMVRKQFYIPKRQNEKLKYLSQKYGLSEAELIRQMIDHEEGIEPRHKLDDILGLTAIDGFTRLALNKRSEGMARQPYRWNRAEIYEERENRWLRDRKDES